MYAEILSQLAVIVKQDNDVSTHFWYFSHKINMPRRMSDVQYTPFHM